MNANMKKYFYFSSRSFIRFGFFCLRPETLRLSPSFQRS